MVLGRLRVTLKSNHMVTDADLSSSPVSGGWNQNTCCYTCWHRRAICGATQQALKVYRSVRRFHRPSVQKWFIWAVFNQSGVPLFIHTSCFCRAATVGATEQRLTRKKKFSRDTAGLEEDIFSVSFLLLEMVMQQLLKLNQAEIQ